MSELEELERSHDVQNATCAASTQEEALARCTELAHAGEEAGAFSLWAGCVQALIPQRTAAPLDHFRLPDHGTLVITKRSVWEPCVERTAYSLTSGLGLSRFMCTFETPNPGRTDAWAATRVAPVALQRISLFAALLDTMQSGPAYARSFSIPFGMTPSVHIAQTPRSWMAADVPELDYRLLDVLDAPLSDSVYAYDEHNPKRRLLAQLLLAVRDSALPTCVDAKDNGEAQRLLEAVVEPDTSSAPNLAQPATQVSCQR